MENKKTKSTIIRDTIALCLITLVAGLILSYTYEITKTPIAQQKENKKLNAYKTVISETEYVELENELTSIAKSMDLTDLSSNYVRVVIDEIVKSYNSSDEMIGYIINVTTAEAYKDPISLTIGYALDGTVTGVEILSINETAGLGMKANDPSFKGKFGNKIIKQFELTKTGAIEVYEIDAISGATITSEAVTNAVNAGIGFVQEYATDLGGGANE